MADITVRRRFILQKFTIFSKNNFTYAVKYSTIVYGRKYIPHVQTKTADLRNKIMGLIKFILGADSRSALKKLNKLALKVEALEQKYTDMSDEELKNQTNILKERLAQGETLDDIMFDAFAAW